MDELVRQVAGLQADMVWVKSILNILLAAVIGVGLTNVAVIAWNLRNGKKK